MKQPLSPSTIGTQSRFAYFLTVKAEVRKFGKSDSQTGSWCLDKAVLAQEGGGVHNFGLVAMFCHGCHEGILERTSTGSFVVALPD